LYSLKVGWEKIFTQERQKLKPNDISVLKCFVLNRLLYEYSKVRISKTDIIIRIFRRVKILTENVLIQ
jgi:hypothetical protein